jgi:hypothetical protein
MSKIEFKETWRPGSRDSKGRSVMFHAGVYRVPQDIDPKLAQRAVFTGAAAHVLEKIAATKVVAPAPKPVAYKTVEQDQYATTVKVTGRWEGKTVVVAATGPSLTPEVAAMCADVPVLAVNDAYRLFPNAEILFACDAGWWSVHEGCPEFKGEKWSSHGSKDHNDKTAAAAAYGLKLISGASGDGFTTEPPIHYGNNSGFQAVNLAILFGAARIVLVGFDMQAAGKAHFFGDHPKPLRNPGAFKSFISAFAKAAKQMPAGVEIINATPDSALTCFPRKALDDALSNPA